MFFQTLLIDQFLDLGIGKGGIPRYQSPKFDDEFVRITVGWGWWRGITIRQLLREELLYQG